jgi:hypothetical protein
VSGVAEAIVQAFSNGDLNAFQSMYSDTVDYLGSGSISSAAVQSQIAEYFQTWPVRRWEIVGPVKVDRIGPSAQRVVFSARYDVSNPETNRHKSGIATETLIVASDSNGAMKITSHHEKTGSGNASDAASDKKQQRRSQRQKVQDGRPVIPLPPGIPWPPSIPRP